jgi:hypothetical protein
MCVSPCGFVSLGFSLRLSLRLRLLPPGYHYDDWALIEDPRIQTYGYREAAGAQTAAVGSTLANNLSILMFVAKRFCAGCLRPVCGLRGRRPRPCARTHQPSLLLTTVPLRFRDTSCRVVAGAAERPPPNNWPAPWLLMLTGLPEVRVAVAIRCQSTTFDVQRLAHPPDSHI